MHMYLNVNILILHNCVAAAAYYGPTCLKFSDVKSTHLCVCIYLNELVSYR